METKELRNILGTLQGSLYKLYVSLEQELSQDWKTYTVTINDVTHEINPECEPAVRTVVIKQLLKDALCAQVDHEANVGDFTGDPFAVINRILSGARKEDHQFEIIKEEVVTNLDADGNPITAKPLNEENVLVQWQDQNRFKFEENA
jgi:hypothetical protein